MTRTRTRTRKEWRPKGRPDAIFLSDTHIRLKQPVCREDCIIEAQERKWAVVRRWQEEFECPVFIGGDLFDKWEYGKKTSWMLTLANAWLPDQVVACAGQHDLPAHSFDRLYESPLGVLEAMGRITVLGGHGSVKRCWTSPYTTFHPFVAYGYSWGDPLDDLAATESVKGGSITRRVAIVHHLVYEGKEPFEGASESGSTARRLMRKLKSFDTILTGDHHRPLVVDEPRAGQLLINPGSMLRTTADQEEHEPAMFFWYAEDNSYERVPFPIEDVITRDHIEETEERDARLEAFISRLRHDVELGVSFESNMRDFCAKNKVPTAVRKIIEEAME